jgi:hypothetical protein
MRFVIHTYGTGTLQASHSANRLGYGSVTSDLAAKKATRPVERNHSLNSGARSRTRRSWAAGVRSRPGSSKWWIGTSGGRVEIVSMRLCYTV